MYTSRILVENYIGRSLTENEIAYLALLIPAINKWIDRKLETTFEKVDATTRYFDGGASSIDIDPATEVTAVKSVDNDGNETYTYVDLTDMVLEPQNENVKREIVRRHGMFPHGSRRIAVTAKFSEYDGGVPEDIKVVATRLAADVLQAGKDSNSGNIKSESIEGHSVTYRDPVTTVDQVASGDPLIKSILDQRKEVLIG